MQRLRTNPLPSKLTQFRSLKTTFALATMCRAQMFAQCHGYPRPAHVVAAVWRYLKMDSVKSIKEGLLKLRDISYYASQALTSLRLMKAEKYQFQLAEVLEYVTERAGDFGFKKLDKEDLTLVAYLMTSAESQETSWMLDLDPESSNNFYAQMLRLYASVSGSAEVGKLTFTKEGDNGRPEISYPQSFLQNQPVYYSPIQDSFVALSDMVVPQGVLRSITEEVATYTLDTNVTSRLEGLRRTISNEYTLYSLSDVRLLDHVLLLMTNTQVWDLFITPRTKPDPSQNVERANGLKTFAGYLQALLVYPHMLRYELFKQGYEALESWHGSFPVIPADIKANYEQYVKAYDFLDATQDAKRLYDLYHVEKDPNLDSTIYVQFTELTTLYGLDDVLMSKKFTTEVSNIRLNHISALGEPTYDDLLLSFPLERFNILDDIQSRMLEKGRFAIISNQMFSAIMPGINKYFEGGQSSKLHNLATRVPFDWHASVAASYSYSRGAIGTITTGKYPMRTNAPWATSENQYALRNVEIFKILNANSLASRYPWLAAVDHSAAEKLRKMIGREWKTYYPSNLIEGDRLVDVATFKASVLDLERLLEYMTGEPFAMIRKALLNDPLSRLWATYLSSFALLYKKTDKMERAVLIEGDGRPYGRTYAELAELQGVTKEDLIQIPKTDLHLVFLKEVPLPALELGISDFHLQIPYYFFPGNGKTLKVGKLTSGLGLLHLALRPVANVSIDEKVVFDKFNAYRNDTLVLQVSNLASFSTDLAANEYFNVPLAPTRWLGDKSASQIDFIAFGNYGGSSSPNAGPEAGSVAQEVIQLTQEMRAELERANKDSSLNKFGENPPSSVVNEASVANEINDTSGTAPMATKPPKQNETKPLDETKKEESPSESKIEEDEDKKKKKKKDDSESSAE